MSEREPRAPSTFPWAAVTACLAVLSGVGLAVGGVYLLAGPGWAMLAGAAPCFLLSAVILRGLLRE